MIDKVHFNNVVLQDHNKSQDNLVRNHNFAQGKCLLFDHKIPIEMKYFDYDRNIKQLGSDQIVNFKIYTFGIKPNITSLRLEIDSDGDPFFSSVFETDENTFSILQEEQKLTFNLQELPTVLIKSLNKIQQSQGKINASLLIYSDGKCKLTIWHTNEYKNIQIISLDLNQQNQDHLEQKVGLKYQQLRQKVLRAQQRLAKINQIIKQKNPSLLMQIIKKTQ